MLWDYSSYSFRRARQRNLLPFDLGKVLFLASQRLAASARLKQGILSPSFWIPHSRKLHSTKLSLRAARSLRLLFCCLLRVKTYLQEKTSVQPPTPVWSPSLGFEIIKWFWQLICFAFVLKNLRTASSEGLARKSKIYLQGLCKLRNAFMNLRIFLSIAEQSAGLAREGSGYLDRAGKVEKWRRRRSLRDPPDSKNPR